MTVAPDTLVCPRCGERAGDARFCATCGLELASLAELPSREAWDRLGSGADRSASPTPLQVPGEGPEQTTEAGRAASPNDKRKGRVRSALRRTYKALDSDTFRSLTYLLSVFGANSNDPAFRRSSENYLRMRALRELRTQNETLSEIASAQSAARTPVQLEPSSDDVAEASIGLEIVERIAKSGPPSQAEFDQFSYYVRFRGLDGPPGTYCMGAIRAGYLARKAEEDIGPTDPDTPVRALLAELQSGEMANASIRVQRGTASAAFAMHMKWHGFALDVLAIEGPVKGSRDVVRTYALKLLTSPGATFTSVPAGVTTELAESAFDFGYALRCTESGGAGHRPS